MLVLMFGLWAWAWAYDNGAPPGHTGGFGEPDCTACHSDNDRNDAAGGLTVTGLPERYVPGESYRLSIVLEHPELEAGGFQLALRTAEGAAAGRVSPVDARTLAVTDGGREYLQHTSEGRRDTDEGRISWQLAWQAPATAVPVILNLAANAANDDLSALGDFIYTLQLELQPVR